MQEGAWIIVRVSVRVYRQFESFVRGQAKAAGSVAASLYGQNWGCDGRWKSERQGAESKVDVDGECGSKAAGPVVASLCGWGKLGLQGARAE